MRTPAGDVGTSLRIPNAVPILAGAFAVCLAVLGLAALAGAHFDRPVGDFTRDPVAVLAQSGCTSGGCMAVGFVSNVGAIIWAASAVMCLFVAIVLRQATGQPARSSPYLYFGLLTLLMTLDDLLLVHEALTHAVPRLSESAVFAAYALLLLAALVFFRGFLARTSAWLLGIAIALFGASVVIDLVAVNAFALEDGVKLLGICAWAIFLSGTAVVETIGAIRRPADAAERSS